MVTPVFWPLWFQQLAVHQDYVWFLVLLGWSLALIFWWWHPQRDTTWRWVPWVAAACVVGAAVQFAIFNPPFDFFHSRLIPGTTANYAPAVIAVELLGDWLIALGLGAAVAGWGWTAAKTQAWRWVALLAAGGAVVLHVGAPEWGGAVLAAGSLVVGLVWLVRHGGTRWQRVLVLAAAAMPALSTVGPLAAWLGQEQRSGPPTAMGLAAAIFQTAVVVGLLLALWRGVVPVRSGLGSPRGERRFIAGMVLWIAGGMALAHQTGQDNRDELQRHRLRLTAARAALLEPAVLQSIDLPPLSLGRIEQDVAQGLPLRVSDETARLTSEVSRALHREWRAAPYVDGVRLIVIEDGWLLAAASSQPFAVAGTIEILRRATAQDLDDWKNARNVIEHSPVAEIGRPYYCRAAIVTPEGRMLGWLEFGQVEFFQSIARKWRSGPLLVTTLGLVLGVMLLFQRRATREREAALRAATVHAEANRLKSEFLAKVSHELRTPLQSLLGYSELVRARVAGEPQAAAWLDAVRQHGELMTRLVNDLIDLGAVEAGTLRLVPRVVAPAELIRQTAGGLRWRAETKGLAFRCEIDPGVPPALQIDAGRLQQVVFNLVGNAVKFTDRGGVTVRVRTEPAGDGHVRLVLAVSDTGPGIAPEDRPRLFEPFTRLASTVEKEGAGLGLALTAALCRAMGGGVEVASEAGAGATFTARITVPVARAAELPVSAEVLAADLTDLHVLIVDDNVLVRELFAAVLGAAGARCTAVGSVAAALAAVRAEAPHAAVLDVALPDGSGFALAGQLKERLPGLRIVGASAHAGDTERMHARDARMDVFLVKPVPPAELVAAVGARAAGARGALPGPRLGRELEELFRREAREKRATLARAVPAADWRTVRAAAHHLANSASVVSDLALLTACNELVEAAERGDAAAAQRRWAECDDRLAAWEIAA